MTVNLLNTGVAGLSERFRNALAEGTKAAAYVEVLDPLGNVVASTGVESSIRLDVDDGSVSVNGSSNIMRSYDVTLVDATGALIPAEATDLLHPLSGNEVRLYRGVEYDDGDQDLVLLITAGIASAPTTWTTEDGLRIELSGFDRARKITRRRLTAPWTVTAGAQYTDEIERLIRARYPEATFRTTPRRHATPPGIAFDEQDDPWARAREMAESIGYRLYADVDGAIVLEPEPVTTDPDVTIAWTYTDGEASTSLGVEVDRSDEGVYSGIIATGEAPSLDVPVRGEAWDENPNSPTYRYGTFGEVPYFMTSQYIATTEQAQDAAAGNLQRVVGLSERVTLEAMVNPAHRPSDVLAIAHERAQVDAAYVLDSFDIPLRGSDTTLETRERFLS